MTAPTRERRLALAPHLNRRIPVLATVEDVWPTHDAHKLHVLFLDVCDLRLQPLCDHAWMFVDTREALALLPGRLMKLRPVVTQYDARQQRHGKHTVQTHRFGLARPEVDGYLPGWAADLLRQEARAQA